ncbi:hypothetical protein BEH94_05415 [Candidatus Altiarchaeales archaeon WOR_SM1_SCG]|nr:hypothetical protein BEH94_05415 [Candidatus Altiarchaeales archaeon WOR_SM1_SCG]
MAEVVISVPEDIKYRMEQFPGINWSGVFKEVIAAKTFEEEFKKSRKMQRAVLEGLASRSKLTGKDALELGKKINRGMAEELKEKGLV